MYSIHSILKKRDKIAVLAITKNGITISKLIKKNIPDASIYAPEKFRSDNNQASIIWFKEPVSKIIVDLFKSNEALICIFSLGAVIRLISNLLVDKKNDPAVLVIDDKCNFVISTLSGHLGGANALTRNIASFLNSTPVITTAADVNKTISVDLLGKELGWNIENFENVTKISALMVNKEKIAIFQDSGEKNWWDMNNLPDNVTIIGSLEAVHDNSFKGGLIISDKIISDTNILSKSVIYRPKTLVVGVGVHWNITKDEIMEGVSSILQENSLSFSCIKAITSIKKKIEVKGLREFCEENNIPLYLYSKDELARIDVPNPSEIVQKYEGVASVSEASSLFYSHGTLEVQKQKFPPNLTIAISKLGFE
jgi:cobalt-precorrin 5A hydrolase